MSEAEPEAKLPKVEDERPVSPSPLRPWQVHAMELREKEKTLSSIQKKLQDLCMQTKHDLSGMSEAERAAKLAKVKEDRAASMREYLRVSAEMSAIKTPDYSGMTEAERAAEADRLRQEKLEEAQRLMLEGDPNGLALEHSARLVDFDPKQEGMYFYRPYFLAPNLDLDEESPIGPMRYTHQSYQNGEMVMFCEAVNILSVKIACSDVGFPIQIYGTVIIRDSIDYKCIYLFRRERDNCQLISSKDEQLILTGPKRGPVLIDNCYVETDLKIKNHQGQDRELSKGYLTIRGITGRTWEKCEVESIATRLSTVEVMYTVVRSAVEGTIEIRVVQGEFCGTITAHTADIRDRIVLYDSQVAGAKTGHGHGVIPLIPSVVSVYRKDVLIIVAKTQDGKSINLMFNPMFNGARTVEITLGAAELHVKVAWSLMFP